MDNLTIRPLHPEDWKIFREIRLHALQDCPNVYLGSYEDAKNRPEQEWKNILDGQDKCIFGLFDDENIIGLTAVFTAQDDPSGQTGILAMSYLKPDYRGKGLSGLFYQARINFAKDHLPWKKLIVSHRKGNDPSRRAMIKHGFVFTETEETDWPDGSRDTEYKYELDLQTLR